MLALQVSKESVLDAETHHLSCAILHSSVSLLLSGFENLIKDKLSSKRRWFSEDVFSCCYVGLLTLWEPAIRDSLVLLVDRSVQSSDPKAIIERVTGSAFMDPSSNVEEVYVSAAVNACKGEIGRQISSRHDKEVERGSVIIHEEPFLATVVADCKCREGPLFVEHLTLAWAYSQHMNNIQEKKLSEKKMQNFLELVQSGLSGNALLSGSLNDICVINEDAECSYLRQNVVPRNITEKYPGSECMCKCGNTISNLNKGREVELEAEVEVEVGSNGNTRDDVGDHMLAQWPFHTQCIMACAAVISLLYDDTIMNADTGCHNHNGTNDCNKRHFLSTNHPFYKRTYLFFQIIARLPQNIHAISRVTTVQTIRSTLPLSGSTTSPSTATATSTSSPLKCDENENNENNENNGETEEEIIQDRAGFGLFLCASAVNHSCAPNCTVRFQFKQESKTNFSTDSEAIEISKRTKSVNNGEMKNDDINRKMKFFSEKEDLQSSYGLEQLMNVRLELVCTKKVLNGSQCFISYGPLASQQTMKERKEFLRNQYLFNCLCSVCGENIKNENETITKIVKNCDIRSLDNIGSTTNVPQNSSMKNVISYDANSIILEKLNVLNNLLSSLRKNLKEINEIFHEIKSRKIINFNEKKEIFEIFDKNRVQPMRELLSSVEIDYFSGNFGEVLNAETFGDINIEDIDINNNIKSKYKKIISSMYTEYCTTYCKTYDISAHISNTIGKHVSTCTFLRKNIDRMTCSRSVGSYAKDDVVVGRERVKLAQAFYLLGDLKKSTEVMLVAESDIGPFVTQSDPDWKEIIKLKRLLGITP